MHWSGMHVGMCACVYARVVSTPALSEFETHAGYVCTFPLCTFPVSRDMETAVPAVPAVCVGEETVGPALCDPDLQALHPLPSLHFPLMSHCRPSDDDGDEDLHSGSKSRVRPAHDTPEALKFQSLAAACQNPQTVADAGAGVGATTAGAKTLFSPVPFASFHTLGPASSTRRVATAQPAAATRQVARAGLDPGHLDPALGKSKKNGEKRPSTSSTVNACVGLALCDVIVIASAREHRCPQCGTHGHEHLDCQHTESSEITDFRGNFQNFFFAPRHRFLEAFPETCVKANLREAIGRCGAST